VLEGPSRAGELGDRSVAGDLGSERQENVGRRGERSEFSGLGLGRLAGGQSGGEGLGQGQVDAPPAAIGSPAPRGIRVRDRRGTGLLGPLAVIFAAPLTDHLEGDMSVGAHAENGGCAEHRGVDAGKEREERLCGAIHGTAMVRIGSVQINR